MSFLDATGLGTFWAKLKNYFLKKSDTEAPVTGLTDILTPVNLLPNSDFSRSGGYADTMTINKLTSGQNAIIADKWFLHAFGATFENITVTRSYNKITLQFTQTSGTAGDNALGLCQPAIKTPSYFKTLTCKTSNYTNVSRVKTYIGGTSQQVLIVIPNCTTGNEHVSMAISKNEGSGSYFEAADVYCQVLNTPVSIDISDCALYMGQFKNPPIVPSFDVNPLNQFLLTDYSNFDPIVLGSQGTTATAGRYRILNLGRLSNRTAHYKFTLIKGFSTYIHIMYPVELYYVADTSLSDLSQTGKYNAMLKCNMVRASTSYSNRISHFSITCDTTTNTLYLNIHISYPLGGNLRLYPDMAGEDIINAWDGTVNTTDTEIVKTAVTDLTF